MNKTKLMRITSLSAVVVAPIAIVVSCGENIAKATLDITGKDLQTAIAEYSTELAKHDFTKIDGLEIKVVGPTATRTFKFTASTTEDSATAMTAFLTAQLQVA